jgi:hypothetical protein
MTHPAPQQIIRSGESVTGGPIQFIGKDTWVKLAGGDLPGSFSIPASFLLPAPFTSRRVSGH